MTNQLKTREEMETQYSPLIEKMKAKYPPECNIEGLEPALTHDIIEIIIASQILMLEDLKKEVEGERREQDESDFECDYDDQMEAYEQKGFNSALSTVTARIDEIINKLKV